MRARTKNTLAEREAIERGARLLTGGHSYDELIDNDQGHYRKVPLIEDPEDGPDDEEDDDSDEFEVIGRTPLTRLLR